LPWKAAPHRLATGDGSECGKYSPEREMRVPGLLAPVMLVAAYVASNHGGQVRVLSGA
jgi:hypothetical protein